MKKTKQKKQQEKVQQEASKIEVVIDKTDPKKPMIDRKATQAKLDIEKKVRAFRAGGRSDQQIANLLGINHDTIKKIK
jgi:hypothetical protein